MFYFLNYYFHMLLGEQRLQFPVESISKKITSYIGAEFSCIDGLVDYPPCHLRSG